MTPSAVVGNAQRREVGVDRCFDQDRRARGRQTTRKSLRDARGTEALSRPQPAVLDALPSLS